VPSHATPATSPSRRTSRRRADALFDPDAVGDDVLALMFVSCHPVLSREARIALTIRVVGGLSSEEIARAFFVPVRTIQARITRAMTLAAARTEGSFFRPGRRGWARTGRRDRRAR